jgi:hypothetical protein
MKEQNLQSHYQYRQSGVPPASYREAIGMKVETKEEEGNIFIIPLPI